MLKVKIEKQDNGKALLIFSFNDGLFENYFHCAKLASISH